MDDRPTPLTDRAAHGFVQVNPQHSNIDAWGIECVDASFARRLERDRARLKEVLQECLGPDFDCETPSNRTHEIRLRARAALASLEEK